MTRDVSVPLWLLILILLFAAVTFASHFLFPSVRWFFRKRALRIVSRLNERLARPIEPFKLARRYDMIQRLVYDPQVTEAIVAEAQAEGIPENVAFERARRYAREIVPSFSATAYFTIGTRVSRWLSKSLYRIRLGREEAEALDGLDREATVVFVMNHRSNLDYVLVTYLISRATALSYAVGEWARVWPLSVLIRAMGAYFIRRRSRGQLYRRVLARYVQLATAGGVTQAIFPEGGLSLDGRVAAPKLGLLSYLIEGWQPDGRDIVFVPVSLNYDRVLEDRILIGADQAGARRFRPAWGTALKAIASHLWDRIRRRFDGFGTASVHFGTPLSLAATPPEARGDVEGIARVLMERIRRGVPVLPVPLVAHLLLTDGPVHAATLSDRVTDALLRLAGSGALLPQRTAAEVAEIGAALLAQRGLVEFEGDQLQIAPEGAPVLRFYAASIAHHFDTDMAPPDLSASAKQ